ncbi:hypothetical protein INR49_022021 [Caranx melampygus]|nr:hypothetical protein INR49_022021 [Caranx melampygus]
MFDGGGSRALSLPAAPVALAGPSLTVDSPQEVRSSSVVFLRLLRFFPLYFLILKTNCATAENRR